ncbi:putative methyltransferase NSUN7 [Rhinichthys klamathensis goyatoka]|uniref:putative methyltransferase NSUN7 n=1 Tax=Rhinichthys klamathensis goyatoka TaxID=3034132 RepID=UPI0024B56CD0|nr:putative methyltransferase NSUN7 [Rhinichthys klamathensis goyatoka]
MVKQTLNSTLDSDLPDVTSLNLLDRESTPKNKAHTPESPKDPMRKVCVQSLKKRVTAVSAERNRVRMERGGAPLGFPDSVYFHAAAIFQKNHVEKDLAHRLIRYGHISPGGDDDDDDDDDDSGIVDDSDANTKQNEHWAYELAFNTLKYQDLLEEILTDSYFYRSQQMPDDLMALVMVVLYDLLDRKFEPREPIKRVEEGLIKEVRQVEDSLYRFKTKLEASLAQCRIKQNLLTIDSYLPPAVRAKQQRSQTVPIYAWVNTLKASIENVCETLRTSGFTQVDSHMHLVGNVFCKDKHCSNVLLFPRRLTKQLEETKLVTEHTLIIQDKSRSLAACAVAPLLVEGGDVLMVGSFSAWTVAHVALRATACSGCVHVCGVLNVSTFNKELQTILTSTGCKNVKLMSEYFNELNEWDMRIQKVRVIVLLPRCSVSALCNPVEFILNENGDRGLLHGLSKGTISDSKLKPLVAKQTQDLKHALNFPKVKGVVYCTCSVYPEENEQLVKRALENAESKAKALPFRLVSAGWDDEKEKFFRIESSDVTNGCFLCVMKREHDPAEAETVQDILARALAKGLLGGLTPPDPLNGEKPKKRKKQKGSTSIVPPSSLIEPPASVMISLSPPAVSVSQTAAAPKHTSRVLTDSSTILDHTSLTKSQTSTFMDATFSTTNHLSLLDPSDNQSSVVLKKRPKGHKPQAKVAKQSGRKKRSKSHTRKERQSRSRPPRKRLLHLRPSQHATVNSIKPTPPQTKPAAIRTPASPYRSRHLHSRATSQRESVKPEKEMVKSEACEPYREETRSRELSLPHVYPLSPSHLSSSPYSSNFSSSLSSSSSIAKGRDSIILRSQTWR